MHEQRPYVAILVARPMAESIFAEEDIAFLAGFADANPLCGLPERMSPEFMAGQLERADACVTGWGTPPLTESLLAGAPRLKLVAHSAGSVKKLIPPCFWQSGRRVTSNAHVIAEDVAQTTLALMLASLKQLFAFDGQTARGGWGGGESGTFQTRRLNGLRVGIVGASMVGRQVIRLIRPFGCDVVLYDPLISPMEAAALGVKPVALDELIAASDVVSLHAPAVEAARHMINERTAPMLKDGCLLINTARGMLIDEPALIRQLRTGRISACLDVTDPEPPGPDHPFRTLPNVVLTPHIAGGHTLNGRRMLGRNAILEIYAYLRRGQLSGEVRREMLDTMA